MSQLPRETAATARARWLADLSRALDDAHRLASELGIPRMHNAEAVELCARLAAARAQVQGLRIGRADEAADEQHPKWSNQPIWPKRTGEEPR